MSSYRKRTQSKPTTAAGLRAQASANGNSIFRNRPRSFSGFFGSSQNSYTSLLGIGPNSYSSSSSGSTPSAALSSKKREYLKNKYSNSAGNLNYHHHHHQSPYTTYGGTASGYGGLTLPAAHTALGLPSTSYGYSHSRGDTFNVQRRGSFNRTKTKPTNASFGSRSSSLQSLASSEGYASGHERSERSSRIGSVTSLSSDASVAPARSKSVTSENGELDYKKLYEESRADNERLRDKLRRSDEQLKDARSQLDKLSAQSKSSLSETEKRERRAMERKLSEMEEELKVMEQLKCENQRLKDENGALIRVISKLSK